MFPVLQNLIEFCCIDKVWSVLVFCAEETFLVSTFSAVFIVVKMNYYLFFKESVSRSRSNRFLTIVADV